MLETSAPLAHRDRGASLLLPTTPRPRTTPRRRWLLTALLAFVLPHLAATHDILGAFIQHSVRLSVSARYIDLQVDLTFFEEWSARERRIMDTDSNGRVTRAEIESYLKRLAPELAEQIKLRVAGADVPLAPLYEPELDLLGTDQVGPAHHRLRLCFFAPAPKSLRAQDPLVIADRLWPSAKALATLQVEAQDHCRLETVETSNSIFPPARPGEARLFTARCLRPPNAEAAPPAASPAKPDSAPLPTTRSTASSPAPSRSSRP